MFQTFAQAWGIKPKLAPQLKAELKAIPKAELKVEPRAEPVLQPKVVEPIQEKPRALEAKQPLAPLETRAERVEQPRKEGEYVSMYYHKHLIYILFLMHITSLVALLLVIFLKK